MGRYLRLIVGVGSVLALRLETATAQTSRSDDLRITVIGCIRRSAPPVDAPAATTVIREDDTRYMLSDITLAGNAPGTGNVKSDLLAQTVTSYRLDDSADAIIAPHVGERVEIAGVVLLKPPAATGTTGTRAPTALSTLPPRLRVDSLRTISNSPTACPR